MPAVGLRQMNTFVLGKHHLTERVEGGDVVRVVDDLVGLHSTNPTTPYISLFIRMRGFRREDLDREMYERRSLAKVRCMRGTVHVLSRELFPIAYQATRHLFAGRAEEYRKHLGFSKKQFEDIADQVMSTIPEGGWTTREARGAVETDLNMSVVLNLLCDQGRLIRWRAPGGWKSNVHMYLRFDRAFPEVELDAMDIEAARRALVERHIDAYGPATLTDISWWSRLTKTDTRRAVETIGDDVTTVEVEGAGGEHLVSASQVDALLSHEPGRRRIVSLVPLQDPYMMGYKDRARYLDEDHTNLVFDRSGNPTTSILLDGRVVGVWDLLEGPSSVVRYHLFEEQSEMVRRKVEREASLIGRFMADREVEVEERDGMVPLFERTAGSFMHPLKD